MIDRGDDKPGAGKRHGGVGMAVDSAPPPPCEITTSGKPSPASGAPMATASAPAPAWPAGAGGGDRVPDPARQRRLVAIGDLDRREADFGGDGDAGDGRAGDEAQHRGAGHGRQDRQSRFF